MIDQNMESISRWYWKF